MDNIPLKPGGFFYPPDDNQELAFRQAVERINEDRMILPRSKLVAQIERISPFDSFHAGKRDIFLILTNKQHSNLISNSMANCGRKVPLENKSLSDIGFRIFKTQMSVGKKLRLDSEASLQIETQAHIKIALEAQVETIIQICPILVSFDDDRQIGRYLFFI
uniref:Uncharacterized protein n=1 Tax=Glossina palpalis gambiensis TaxID=67801 RepID=A0A1B0AWM4_9MUSC